ncbi:hypothetical protein ABH920_004507 [Catenulispora sp. EB89]|uniref:RICIN domain-containing protein n=1 Tax=Catenulispora sp. EB89 TaxID=3156257 RepID=UPI0035172491
MNKIFGLLAPAVALTAAAVAGTGAAAAQAAPAPASHAGSHVVKPFDGVFEPIRNVGNNLCLEPTQPAGPNSPVLQEPCAQPGTPGNDFILQGWQTIQLSGSTYKFINNGSGACLFAFTSAHNGAPMGLDTCRNVSNEEFDAHTTLPNVSVLESKIGFSDTGFCMDVPGASTNTGLQLQLFNCNGTLAQRWVIGFPPPAP